MAVSIVRADNYDQETVKSALDQAHKDLGLDVDNPYKDIAKPGDRVFIKPNWVAHQYRASCPSQHSVFTTITHPQVIKQVALYVDRALEGSGSITIGDNPSIDADFEQLLREQELDEFITNLNTPSRVLDLRPLVCNDLNDYGHQKKMHSQRGDPEGHTVINLGKESKLYGINPRLFRGVFNERGETIRSHSDETHEYSFSNSIFNSDLFISIPKLKTHHKVGTTLNLKGLVGTIGVKNQLVHWKEGFPLIGGDAYPNFNSWFMDKFRRVKKRGAWDGNDTIWRMVVDLYQAIQLGPKRYFTVMDGILGGQGNGPFCPTPKDSKVIMASSDFLEMDLVATRLMGFNVEQVRYLHHLIKSNNVQLDAINVISDFIEKDGFFKSNSDYLSFIPPSGWKKLRRN